MVFVSVVVVAAMFVVVVAAVVANGGGVGDVASGYGVLIAVVAFVLHAVGPVRFHQLIVGHYANNDHLHHSSGPVVVSEHPIRLAQALGYGRHLYQSVVGSYQSYVIAAPSYQEVEFGPSNRDLP